MGRPGRMGRFPEKRRTGNGCLQAWPGGAVIMPPGLDFLLTYACKMKKYDMNGIDNK